VGNALRKFKAKLKRVGCTGVPLLYAFLRGQPIKTAVTFYTSKGSRIERKR
jgi:hypothetical protein